MTSAYDAYATEVCRRPNCEIALFMVAKASQNDETRGKNKKHVPLSPSLISVSVIAAIESRSWRDFVIIVRRVDCAIVRGIRGLSRG